MWFPARWLAAIVVIVQRRRAGDTWRHCFRQPPILTSLIRDDSLDCRSELGLACKRLWKLYSESRFAGGHKMVVRLASARCRLT